MSIKICLIKTLLRKNTQWKKILLKEKEYNSLVKNLTRKIQWDKTMVKGKKSANYIYISPSIKQSSLRQWRSIFCISCSKIMLGGALWKCLQDYHMNTFVDWLIIILMKITLFQVRNAHDIIFINECFIHSFGRQNANFFYVFNHRPQPNTFLTFFM